MLRTIALVPALLVALAAFAAVDVPLQSLKPGATSGFETKATTAAGKVTLAFRKTGEERRLLAVEGAPAGDPSGALAAEVSYQISLTKGEAPRLAVVAWDKDGGSWYKVAASAAKLDGAATGRVSAAGLTETAFSNDRSKQLEWGNVERLWVGFIFDGPAEGTATISGVRLTDTPVVQTEPLPFINVGGTWNDGHDPAVQTTLTTPAEGPAGKTCFKYEFSVPAGTHMYACPSTAVVADDTEGYKALRFMIKGDVPDGMRLLVQMSEQGGPMWFVEYPADRVTDEWAEMTIPLTDFQNATWGPKDENGQLDLAKLTTLSIGSHGAAINAQLGTITVCGVVLVP